MSSKTELLNFKKYVHPLKSIIHHLSLLDSQNDVFLSCYIFCLLLSVLWLLWFALRKITSPIVDMHKILYEAVLEGNNVEAIRIIRKYPASINKFDTTDGYTPFLKACMSGNTQLVKYMLTIGADLSISSHRNESPFYLAIYNHIKNRSSKDASCIHALFYAGANINASNDKGYNPLQLACSYGHTSLVKWLMEKGADDNILPDPYLLARVQGHVNTALVFKNLKCKRNRNKV